MLTATDRTRTQPFRASRVPTLRAITDPYAATEARKTTSLEVRQIMMPIGATLAPHTTDAIKKSPKSSQLG